MGGPQSRYGRGGQEKKITTTPCRELNPGRPARGVVSILTELPPTLERSTMLIWDIT